MYVRSPVHLLTLIVVAALAGCGRPVVPRPQRIATPWPALPSATEQRCPAPLESTHARVVELVGTEQLTCVRTDAHELACWGVDPALTCKGGDRVARAPMRLALDGTAPLFVGWTGACTIRNRQVSCTAGVHRTLGGAGDGHLAVFEGARQVAIGERFVCALVRDEVRCAVAAGTTRMAFAGGHPVASADGLYVAGTLPIVRPRRLVATRFTACVLDADGAVWCWGDGAFNTLGVPGAADVTVPIRVSIPGNVVALTASSASTCARTTEDLVYCWGGVFCAVPARIAGTDVREVALGYDYACTRDGQGTILCTGKTKHMLGVDPPRFSGRVAQLAAGSHHICARLETGAVECLGAQGSLGDGSDDEGESYPDGSFSIVMVSSPVHILGPTASPHGT